MNSNSLGHTSVTTTVSDGCAVAATSWLRQPPSVTDTTQLLGVSPSNTPALPGHCHLCTAWQNLAARVGPKFTQRLRLRYKEGNLLPSSSQLSMEARPPEPSPLQAWSSDQQHEHPWSSVMGTPDLLGPRWSARTGLFEKPVLPYISPYLPWHLF